MPSVGSSIPPDLEDEITSLNSIYADGTFQILSPDANTLTASLSPPAAVINPPVELKIRFDYDYPNSAPVILEGTTNGKGLSRGEVLQVARDVLGQIWMPGGVVMFELVEALKEVLHREPDSEEAAEPETTISQEQEKDEEQPGTDIERENDNNNPDNINANTSQIPWAITPTTTVQKSVFVGRAVRVASVNQAKGYVEELIATDRKVAKATHNITAWRIKTEDGVQFQDNDDDGETAAGSRLAHLLELIGIWNVMVVVTRWYGGVKLGPDRFRIINQVAREALDIGGFINADAGAGGKSKASGGSSSHSKEKGKSSKGR